MKKKFVLLFAFGVITGQMWAETGNLGWDFFGFAHNSKLALSSSIDWWGPHDGYPLSFGFLIGFYDIDVVNDRNQFPTNDEPNFKIVGLAIPMALRVGYHFLPKSTKIDPYVMVTGGYFIIADSRISEDNLTPKNSTAHKKAREYLPTPGWPIAEAGAGIRYFFSNTFGVYSEIGFNPMPIINKPFFQLWSGRLEVGLTYHFRFID